MAYIKKIKLPGQSEAYDIYDAAAIHSLEDIQGLGLEGAFIFKGTVATVADLPSAGNNVGWVYHVIENESEYVWITEGRWEEFGHHMTVEHVHQFTGTATITGENSSSDVTGTGTGSITIPKVSKSANYIKVNGSVSAVAVAEDGTAAPITGFGAHTTADAITGLNTTSINNPTVTDISIPNVTDNVAVTASKVSATAGSAAVWSGTVDEDGTLNISWTTNIPTTVSASDVDASKVTLGSALRASQVSISSITVATGSNSTAKAITALGTPTTATVLTGVKVSTQPTLSVSLAEGSSSDGILVGDTVAVTSETKDISVNISGTAAAQTWTQKSGTVSGTTGQPE